MKTKLVLLLFAVILLGSTAIGQVQEDEDMKLLFKPKHEKQSNGGYGAFQIGWTQINGKSAVSFGGRGAWVANHYFALGLAGTGFYSDAFDIPNKVNSTYAMYGGYGGIMIEPIIASMSTFHVSFPILFGGGGVIASNYDMYYPYTDNYYTNYYEDMDPYFIFQPGVELEVNIVKFFRLALGVSYKLTDGVNLQYKYFDDNNNPQVINIDKKAIDGWVATITFKFGKF